MSFGSKSLPPPTEDEARRIEACKAKGCIACIITGQSVHCGHPEYNHILVGSVRAGHRHGYCLGAWHHQARSDEGDMIEWLRNEYGPSLRNGSKLFHSAYGTDQYLQNITDDLIGWPRVKIERQKKAKSSTQRSSKTIRRGQKSSDEFAS